LLPRKALAKHRNVAERLIAKIEQYAETPEALADSVTGLRGSAAKRLRVGNLRIVFEETAAEIIVTKIGPRGSIYED
jgi:mRNA interferase RelE/StbE